MLKDLAGFLARFDNLFIFMFAAVNFFVFFSCLRRRKQADLLVHPVGDKRFGVTGLADIRREEAVELRKARDKVCNLYALYANFTAIFPLLGILGTVASLITISETENMMDNLMVALTTTLNGVCWAIVFKSIESILSAPLDTFLDDMEYVIKKAEKATPDFKVKKMPNGTVEYVASYNTRGENDEA